jgi:Xaa-Pro aminopeptidase
MPHSEKGPLASHRNGRANAATHAVAENRPHFQCDFSAAEFARRRADVARAIGNGVAVLQGLPETGAFSLFRQHNDFFYLSGVEVPHAYLTIEGETGRSTLYLLPRDEVTASSEGVELNADDAEMARRVTGFDAVRPTTELCDALPLSRPLYLCTAHPEGRQACQDTQRHAFRRAERDLLRNRATGSDQLAGALRAHRPQREIRDLSPILAKMRLIKSPAELYEMRKTGDLAARAVEESIRSTQVSVFEYELAAVAEYVFLVNGAVGGGYRPIVASGDNIWNMHYYRNNCRLADGDLVLMDYAPDLANYTNDIGRMWPVNGRYSAVQRDLYGFVVDYHSALLEVIGPGETAADLRMIAAERMRPLASRTKWSKAIYSDAVERLLTTAQPFTHPVGMAVHDVGSYRDAPLEPGLVFALDPQLWVPEERLYIRVEDTVAVTASGVENLTRGAPLDLDEVERLVGSGGMLQAFPPAMRPANVAAELVP